MSALFSMLLAIASLFVPVPAAPPSVVTLPPVAAAAPFGVDSLVLLHADGSLTVAAAAAVVVLDATPNGFGMPSTIGINTSSEGAGPHSYTTSYNSATGAHTVTTPCSSYPNLTDCARRHQAAVQALQAVFPRV